MAHALIALICAFHVYYMYSLAVHLIILIELLLKVITFVRTITCAESNEFWYAYRDIKNQYV